MDSFWWNKRKTKGCKTQNLRWKGYNSVTYIQNLDFILIIAQIWSSFNFAKVTLKLFEYFGNTVQKKRKSSKMKRNPVPGCISNYLLNLVAVSCLLAEN